MKQRFSILVIAFIYLLSACGTPTYSVSAPGQATTDPFIAVEQAERTADAARNEADFYSRQLTATAEAPIVAITATAAAFAMEMEFAQATRQAQMATETAAMTSTAMNWTPTANATATKMAIMIQADGTHTANQLELDNLMVERERTMNFVKAMSWYVVGFGAFLLFLIPRTRRHPVTLNLGCVLIFVGVYLEKGMGLVIPGMTPDTLGEIYEYFPTLNELLVSAGILAVGSLAFTVLVKVATPIMLDHNTEAPAE